MADVPVPKTTIATLKDIIEGYYKAGEVGDDITNEEVANVIDVGSDIISRQKKFLAEIGVLEKDGHTYILQEQGNKIGLALSYGREEKAADQFRDLLKQWRITDQLISELGTKMHPREDIVEEFAYLTETQISMSRKERGLNTLVDIYVWADILEETDSDKYQLSIEEDEGTVNDDEHTSDGETTRVNQSGSETNSSRPDQEEITKSVEKDSDPVHMEKNIPISVSLNLSGDEDPENVRDLIIAVRQGFTIDLDETPVESSGKNPEGTASLSDFSRTE